MDYTIVSTGWTELTALSTVGIYQQFTLADSPLCSRKIHDGSWCLCLAASRAHRWLASL